MCIWIPNADTAPSVPCPQLDRECSPERDLRRFPRLQRPGAAGPGPRRGRGALRRTSRPRRQGHRGRPAPLVRVRRDPPALHQGPRRLLVAARGPDAGPVDAAQGRHRPDQLGARPRGRRLLEHPRRQAPATVLLGGPLRGRPRGPVQRAHPPRTPQEHALW